MPLLENIHPALFILYAIPVYIVLNALYRAYVVPLSRIPGDRLAAASGLYELFYDCWKPGQYFLRILDMHDRFGPVVRIGPNEVHIQDSAFFDQFYTSTAGLAKPEHYYQFADAQYSTFETRGAEMHRFRRGGLLKFFGREHIDQLGPIFQKKTQQFLDRVREKKQTGEVVDLYSAYRSYAMDIASQLTVPGDFDLLGRYDFASLFHRIRRNFLKLSIWDRNVKIVVPLVRSLPGTVVSWIVPWAHFILRASRDINNATKETATTQLAPGPPLRATAVETLISTEHPENKDPTRLSHEARSIIAQGTETVGRALEVITYQVLANPAIYQRLKTELQALPRKGNDVLDQAILEQSNYLAAVISEGLRMATPVSGRLPRINNRDATKIHGFVIPPETIISMTPSHVHSDERIFSAPDLFRPERWEKAEDRAKLQKHLVVFGRGSRNCLGIFVAYKELYMLLGNLFRDFDLELFSTGKSDVLMNSDYFFAFSNENSRGLRVSVK